MANNEFLSSFSKEELIRLIGAYSRNWLAMDGAWFQAAERDYGMDAAMELDRAAFPDREVELAALPLSICCHIGGGALAIACAEV